VDEQPVLLLHVFYGTNEPIGQDQRTGFPLDCVRSSAEKPRLQQVIFLVGDPSSQSYPVPARVRVPHLSRALSRLPPGLHLGPSGPLRNGDLPSRCFREGSFLPNGDDPRI